MRFLSWLTRKAGATPGGVNIASPAHKADPFPSYTRLRAESPVCPVTLPDRQTAWLVTRNEDGAAVLRDDRFAKDRSAAPPPGAFAPAPGGPGSAKAHHVPGAISHQPRPVWKGVRVAQPSQVSQPAPPSSPLVGATRLGWADRRRLGGYGGWGGSVTHLGCPSRVQFPRRCVTATQRVAAGLQECRTSPVAS